MEPVYFALILTFIAGISTSIGGILGIMNKKPSARFISFIMAFSAGVMVFLSFTEMFAEAKEYMGMSQALLWLGVGCAIAFVIDLVIPEQENLHEHLQCPARIETENNSQTNSCESVEIMSQNQSIIQSNMRGRRGRHRRFMNNPEDSNTPMSPMHGQRMHHRGKRGMGFHANKEFKQKCLKMGIFSILALFVHNIPEGFATFSASLVDSSLGIQIALATALHNIPEGICVAVPIYIATNDKKKALLYATISGLAEPLGALLAWAFLAPFITEGILMGMLAVVAGIMVYISVDSLIPTAKSLEVKHTSVAGFVLGMIVIGISLIFV